MHYIQSLKFIIFLLYSGVQKAHITFAQLPCSFCIFCFVKLIAVLIFQLYLKVNHIILFCNYLNRTMEVSNVFYRFIKFSSESCWRNVFSICESSQEENQNLCVCKISTVRFNTFLSKHTLYNIMLVCR